MKVIPYAPETHYPIACSWWREHNWPAPAEELLPTTGLVALHGEKPIAMVFLYTGDSALAWMEFLIADPASEKTARSESIDLLVYSTLDLAKKRGYAAVFTSSNMPKLISRYLRHGFVVGDTETTQLVRRL